MNFRILKDNLQSPELNRLLSSQLQQLELAFWHLEQDARYSGVFDEKTIKLSVISSKLNEPVLQVKVGIFIAEAETPCPCAGEEISYNELYCERVLMLDMRHNTYSLSE